MAPLDENTPSIVHDKQSAKRFTMPAVVLGLLGSHVLFIIIAITLATGDRSFAVVPDYYQKAVAFDDRKAQLAQSAALGWQVELEPAETIDSHGRRGVVVRLRDRDGTQISGAELRVSCYHLSRAGEPVNMELVEALPGQYVGKGRLGREGFWSFDLVAKVQKTRFVSAFKQFVFEAEQSR